MVTKKEASPGYTLRDPGILTDNMELGDFTERALKIYGEEVNLNRAVPDYRDGLKPVTRRILWSLNSMPKGVMMKTARLVGDCFASGTMVRLSGGASIPIEQVVIGDEVETDVGPRTTTKVFVKPDKELYEVKTDKGTVKATPDQIFYCINEAGLEVERTPLTLKPGDRIKM